MTEVVSYCRACEGACGVIATIDGDRISKLRGDVENPMSRGFLCEAGRASAEATRHATRVTQPMRREGDRFVPVDWDTAIREIGEKLGAIRRSAGARAVGVYAGGSVGASPRDVARTAAFALAIGTPNLFTAFASIASPQMLATEKVIGHPTALQADVGRAHYTVLLGGNQGTGQWGPLQQGSVQTEMLEHAKKARKAKLVVADPRRGPLAEKADVHLPIRPGTDVHLLLGMVGAAIEGGWYDHQYVRDYTTGIDGLREAVKRWNPETAAAACGVDRGALSGVALKFARAAMGAVHRGRGMLLSGHGTAASFAWLALHGITANLLRAGGLYDAPGLVDLEPIVRAVPSGKAPRARVAGVPSVLMQLPGSLLTEEILVPGEGQVRALVCVEGDPARSLPGTKDVDRALGSLDLLVCLSPFETETTKKAHWVLPTPHFWEREDAHLLDSSTLPFRFTQRAHPLVPAPQGARTVEHVLRDLLGAAKPSAFGGAWGAHLVMLGRLMGRADLARWEDRAWDLLSDVSRDELANAPHGVMRGDIDRTRWSVSHPDGRLRFDDPDMLEALANVPAPDPDDRLFLGSRTRTVGQPMPTPADPADRLVAEISAEAAARLGLADGQEAVLSGEGGEAPVRVSVDSALRADAVVVPNAWGPAAEGGGARATALSVLVSGRRDPLTGAPAIAGSRVTLRKAR
jgi:anaerobic selenocysteine-containing dehydrogenase